MINGITRRDAIKLAGSAAILGGLVNPLDTAAGDTRSRRRALRVAHLTDIHLQPELHAAEGLAACLRHVQSQNDVPELILAGGDLIMDAFDADLDRTKLQWKLWNQVTAAECSLPIESCLGNHDIWGWNKQKSKTQGNEPGWGKRWACDVLGLEKSFRSFDRAGWHFVVLDSIFHDNKDVFYLGRLDEEQWEWLQSDLAATPPNVPVVVLSHIPILSACVFPGTSQLTKQDNHVVYGTIMHTDYARILPLFVRYPQVKLCLSGHIHLHDRVDYAGVTYLCNGAVCGNWWKGAYQQTKPGYAMIDLYDNGTFSHEYVSYA